MLFAVFLVLCTVSEFYCCCSTGSSRVLSTSCEKCKYHSIGVFVIVILQPTNFGTTGRSRPVAIAARRYY